MADPNMNKTPEDMKKNETTQRDQSKWDQDKNRQPEKGGADKEREEKSAIGGGQSGQSPTGQSGQTGQQSGQQFDKSRSEPTNR
jgi:hypothetical protein